MYVERRNHLRRARDLRVEMMAMKLAKVTSVEMAVNLIRRRKDRQWFTLLLKFMARGVEMDEALEASTRMTYGNLADANTQSVMKKAMAKLHQPDICKATEEIFALKNFTMENAVEMQIKHITGAIVKDVVIKVRDADGNEQVEVTQMNMPPNYTALKDYFARVLPNQTQKLAVATVNINEMMMKEIESESSFETLECRIVGEPIDTNPTLSEDDVDPFPDDYEDDDDEDEADD